MTLHFSFIIPVYNRPQEIKELLDSMISLNFTDSFEVVIVEDGSSETSKQVVQAYSDKLDILYLTKPNTGPGDSRNYGMARATGNYFLILDSDVIVPPNYLNAVQQGLESNFTHCFGGPDDAAASFSKLQKAINFAMTSFITTGGIRGRKSAVNNFEPRSFNMGLSKEAFQSSKGFGKIHPGEDPDLAIRLHKLGYKTQLLVNAKVYHKRRISWRKFYKQVNKFGNVRPILNMWHPETKKVTYWFPSVFIFALVLSFLALIVDVVWPIALFGAYFLIVFLSSSIKNNSLAIGFMSVWAVLIQFYGYGIAFAVASFYIRVLNKNPKEHYPQLFFD